MASAIIAGAVVGAVGQVFNGIQAYQQGNFTKSQLNSQAANTEKEAAWAANRIRARARRLAATQRTRFAAGGIDLSGSAVDVQMDSAMQAEIDAMTTIYKGNIAGASMRTQGNSAQKSGFASLVTSGISAAGTILGGIGTANMMKSGLNPSFVGDINTGNAASYA